MPVNTLCNQHSEKQNLIVSVEVLCSHALFWSPSPHRGSGDGEFSVGFKLYRKGRYVESGVVSPRVFVIPAYGCWSRFAHPHGRVVLTQMNMVQLVHSGGAAGVAKDATAKGCSVRCLMSTQMRCCWLNARDGNCWVRVVPGRV